MEKQKFRIPGEPETFEETLKGLYKLNYDDTGIEFKEKFDEKDRLVGLEYKDTLSDSEALKNMRVSEIRMRNGSAKIEYHDDGKTSMIIDVVGMQARKTLGIKHFSKGFTFDYHWERGFDEAGHRIYAKGVIEGEDYYMRDKDGRITSSVLDNGRETNTFDYDEKGRISNWQHTYKDVNRGDEDNKRHFEYDEDGSYTVKSINKRGNKISSIGETKCNAQNEILSEVYKDKDLVVYFEKQFRPQEDDYMSFRYDDKPGKIDYITIDDGKNYHTIRGDFKFDKETYLAVPNSVLLACENSEMLDKAVEYEKGREGAIISNLSKMRTKIGETNAATQLAQSVMPKRSSHRSAKTSKEIEM